MFVIGTTQKLAKELNKTLEPQDHVETPEINKWHMNMFKWNDRKCVLLMNDKTGLNLLLFGLEKEQFENIDNVLKGSLKQLLQLLELDQEIKDQFLEASEEIVYTKTSNRRVLGMMREIKTTVESMLEGVSYEDVDAADINRMNNMDRIFTALQNQTPSKVVEQYFNLG
ncbi:hypothetical protein [Thalassobacillus sp. CUG 92003]|uniref:DUF6933 domain-containing protein n=1 Tax=Thalassobacillus sp. CUG 92003 TaxID=2736641 RepID=UPI0015E682F6|nr:hypothetical protein [Thalassobacillus sp. CUG 92003]